MAAEHLIAPADHNLVHIRMGADLADHFFRIQDHVGDPYFISMVLAGELCVRHRLALVSGSHPQDHRFGGNSIKSDMKS